MHAAAPSCKKVMVSVSVLRGSGRRPLMIRLAFLAWTSSASPILSHTCLFLHGRPVHANLTALHLWFLSHTCLFLHGRPVHTHLTSLQPWVLTHKWGAAHLLALDAAGPGPQLHMQTSVKKVSPATPTTFSALRFLSRVRWTMAPPLARRRA